MRISDWSSDVCSSDLVFVALDELRPAQQAQARPLLGLELEVGLGEGGTRTKDLRACSASGQTGGRYQEITSRNGHCSFLPCLVRACQLHPPPRLAVDAMHEVEAWHQPDLLTKNGRASCRERVGQSG